MSALVLAANKLTMHYERRRNVGDSIIKIDRTKISNSIQPKPVEEVHRLFVLISDRVQIDRATHIVCEANIT